MSDVHANASNYMPNHESKPKISNVYVLVY